MHAVILTEMVASDWARWFDHCFERQYLRKSLRTRLKVVQAMVLN
jgi:hypothetical protein